MAICEDCGNEYDENGGLTRTFLCPTCIRAYAGEKEYDPFGDSETDYGDGPGA